MNMNKVGIDSLRIEMPLNLCNILDNELTASYSIIDNDTGEIVESEYKKKAKEYLINGSIVRAAIVKGNTNQPIKNKQYDRLTITLSSKVLKDKYFDKITTSTLEQVYNNLLEYNIFVTDYDTFLKAYCYDIDIAQDFILNEESYKILIDSLYESIRKTKLNKVLITKYNKGDNIGLQFNKRDTSTITNPYIKLYNKESYIKGDSNIAKKYKEGYKLNRTDRGLALTFIFNETYLKDVLYLNTRRIEGQIKNNKHLNSITNQITKENIENSLYDITKYVANFGEYIISILLSKYIEEVNNNKKTVNNNKEMTRTMECISIMLQLASEEDIIKVATKTFDENKTPKGRKRKQMFFNELSELSNMSKEQIENKSNNYTQANNMIKSFLLPMPNKEEIEKRRNAVQ